MNLRNLPAFTSPGLGLQTTVPVDHMGSGEMPNTVLVSLRVWAPIHHGGNTENIKIQLIPRHTPPPPLLWREESSGTDTSLPTDGMEKTERYSWFHMAHLTITPARKEGRKSSGTDTSHTYWWDDGWGTLGVKTIWLIEIAVLHCILISLLLMVKMFAGSRCVLVHGDFQKYWMQ